jgi:hypothetical protein
LRPARPRSLPDLGTGHPAGNDLAGDRIGPVDFGQLGRTNRRPGLTCRSGAGTYVLDLYRLPGPDRRRVPCWGAAPGERVARPGRWTGLAPSGRPNRVCDPWGHPRARPHRGSDRRVARSWRTIEVGLDYSAPWPYATAVIALDRPRKSGPTSGSGPSLFVLFYA